MHPVIKHINNRRHKSVPVADGRKIILVLFGGAMLGARGAGAMMAFEELKLNHAFDEIYTISGGLANASYLLAEQAHYGTSIYYEDMCSKKFFNPLRFWKVLNVDYIVHVIRSIKKLNVEKVLTAKTKLFVKLFNLKDKKYEYLNVNDFGPRVYFNISKDAFSIPYLNPGSVKLNHNYYKDSGLNVHELVGHLEHAVASDATDVLAIYNYFEQSEFTRKGGIVSSDRVYQIIPPKDIKFGHFCTDSNILKKAAEEMGFMVKNLFGETGGISLKYKD